MATSESALRAQRTKTGTSRIALSYLYSSRKPHRMSPVALFDLYRTERATRPIAGFDLEVLPHLSRFNVTLPGAESFVVFARLPPGGESLAIDEQIEYFSHRGATFEWKVYELDEPATLRTQLEHRGFGCDDAELFMASDPNVWVARSTAVPGLDIRCVRDESGLRDIVRVQEAIHGDDFGVFERYARILREAPETVALYGAYRDGRIIGCGWIDFFPGSAFADLHGGSVLPEERSRGVFSALLDRRMAEARQRGIRFVAVDAAPMSRPILERKGFQPICWTFPLRQRVT